MEVSVNTLLEFIVATKAVSYVVAVLLMVGFIPFYLFLTERDKR